MSITGYILIADISGYKEFIRLHNLKKTSVIGKFMARQYESHASKIIADLLEKVIGSIKPVMNLNKLIGNSALFYCEENKNKNQSDEIINIMHKANKTFKEKKSELVFVQACGCEPCTQSKNLKLKILAHKGIFKINKIRNFEEISGEDVILTHRMLKNDIKSNEYWLVTENFYSSLNKINKDIFAKITLNLKGFDKIKLNLIKFNSIEPRNSSIEKRSWLHNWFIQAIYFGSAMFNKN